ncbi:MAG TPA: hypothetical protein V6C91_14490, partial [Coleofasciculaceae cyanobacterium]
TMGIIALQVKPYKWWRRPIYGGGRLIHFGIKLEDPQLLTLPTDLPQGALLWEARPWWQFLLVLLTTVGSLVAIAFLIWWLFFRPPAPPKIAEFSSDDLSYQEASGDLVRLNWQIRNPRQIQTIAITGQPSNGATPVQPVSYDFSRGVPAPLKDFCIIRAMLICKHVPTEARQPGDYVFELKVFSKQKKDTPVDVVKTNTIAIQPVTPPKISEFSSTKPTYQEARNITQEGRGQNLTFNSPNAGDTILLNWQIENPEQLQELKLIGRAPDGSVTSALKRYNFTKGIPENLQKFCIASNKIICKSVPTETRKPGEYIFELTAVPKKGQTEKPISAKTDTIKILPNIVPINIVSFQVNGRNAGGKYIVPLNPATPIKPLILSWQVQGGKDTKVELLPAPGTVPPQGAISYPLSQQPSTETLTLKVTNGAGQEISRSVTFETLIPPKPEPSPTPTRSARTQTSPVRPPGLPVLPLKPPPSLPSFPLPSPLALPSPSPAPSAATVSPSPSAQSSPSLSPEGSPSSSPTASPSPSPTTSPSLPPGGSLSPADPETLSPSELPPRFD